MSITLSDLARIAELYIDPSLAQRTVFTVIRYCPGIPLAEGVLYVGTPQEMESAPCPELFLSTETGFGRIHVLETSDPEDVLRRCDSAFHLLRQVEDACHALDRALLSGKGYPAIIETGSELLSNPLLMVDKSFKVMAYGGCKGHSDDFLSEIIRTGYYPENYISELAQSVGLKLFESRESLPDIVSEGNSPKRYITTDLIYQNKFFGFITLEEEQPFHSGDREIFRHLESVLISELRSMSGRDAEGTVSETVLLELLNGQLHGGRLKARMEQAGFDFSSGAYVFVIKNRAEAKQRQRYDYLLSYVVSQLQYCPCAIYNDGIVGIIDSENTDRGKIARMALYDFLDYYGMVCGISNRIDRAEDLPVFFAQGVCAQQYGQLLHGEGPIYLYETYCFYQILDHISASASLHRFCSPKYMYIMEHDRQNGTEYIPTINAYLEACKDLALAARALYLHRNTVSYRIRKASELFHVDFEDKDTFFSFLLTMRILRFIAVEKEINL